MPKPISRLRCPSCNSLRVNGDRFKFKCKVCGFVHDFTKKEVRKE